MLVFKNIAVATALGLITQFGNAESSSSLLGFVEERMSEMNELAQKVKETTRQSLNQIAEETNAELTEEDPNDIFSIVRGMPDEAARERVQSLLDNNDVDGAKEVFLEYIETYVSGLSDEEKARAESHKNEVIATATAAFDKYKAENDGPVVDSAFEEELSEGVDTSSNLALAFAGGDETERYFGPADGYAFEEEQSAVEEERSEEAGAGSDLALAFARGDETERYFGPADGYAFEDEQSSFEEEQSLKAMIASKLALAFAGEDETEKQEQSAFEEERSEGAGAGSDLALAFAGSDETERYFGPADGYAFEQEQSAFEEERSEGAGAGSDLALAFAGGDETERYFGPADGYAFEQEQSEGADEKLSKLADALEEVAMAQDKIANLLKEVEDKMP